MTVIDLIKRHEGLQLKPYRDTMGNYSVDGTICVK